MPPFDWNTKSLIWVPPCSSDNVSCGDKIVTHSMLVIDGNTPFGFLQEEKRLLTRLQNLKYNLSCLKRSLKDQNLDFNRSIGFEAYQNLWSKLSNLTVKIKDLETALMGHARTLEMDHTIPFPYRELERLESENNSFKRLLERIIHSTIRF